MTLAFLVVLPALCVALKGLCHYHPRATWAPPRPPAEKAK